MAVAPFLPRHIPMIVGTEDILLRARAAGHDATLLEPPVDTLANAPGIDSSRFRSSLAVDPDCLLIVVVGRISKELKLEGLLSACDAISALAARGVGVRLAVVGAGGASDLVAERARRANALAGREVVTLVGSMADPRPAYAAADVLLGMGGSALRGMAFAKPLIVQGELGFWRLCTPETAASFLKGGWYGLGDIEFPLTEAGHANSASRLILELEPLIFDARYREELGRFGRELVVGRFSLDRATAIQERVYEEAVKNKRGAHVLDAARSVSGAAIHTVRQRLLRKLNLGSSEDFNTVLAQKGRPR
jgi:glycosyltransferase involved in cell wall biosynthesis